MMKHLCLITLILTFYTVISTTTAHAQDSQEIFLPSVFGYVEPEPEVPTPTEPAPYNLDMHNLVIYPADLGHYPDPKGSYDYDLQQDEPIEFTDEARRRGMVNGYITYMVSNEEDIRKAPFVLGTYAILFTNPEQAQTYYESVKQSLENDGFQHYRAYTNHVHVYVEKEEVQKITILYAHTISYVENIFFYSYSVSAEGYGAYPLDYVVGMLNKLGVPTSSTSRAAHSIEESPLITPDTLSVPAFDLNKSLKLILP